METKLAKTNQHNRLATLSGPLGLVIIPDQQTIDRAFKLAAEILPPGSEYILHPGSLPHLTLYHGKLRDVPVEEIALIVHDLRQSLVGHNFHLGKIVGFGGKFVFWNVNQDQALDSKVLSSAHEKALSLARFLDRASVPKATSEEGLSLSDAELENVRLFGHPFVRQLYTPHITLGFHRGVAQTIPANSMREVRFTVASVELVYIGYPGRVENVIDLEKAV